MSTNLVTPHNSAVRSYTLLIDYTIAIGIMDTVLKTWAQPGHRMPASAKTAGFLFT